MPRVALIYPCFRTHASSEMLFSPLGVASLASQLHQLGIEARVFDCTFSSMDELLRDLHDFLPDIFGIYAMITLSRNAFRIASMIRREFPGRMLIAGGPLPTLYPDQFTSTFDAVFRGEADLSFPQFCADLFAQPVINAGSVAHLDLSSYRGLFLHQNGHQVMNPAIFHSEQDRNQFPLPYRGDFDHGAYQNAGLERDGRRTTSIITTYGCSYDCDFCSKPIFGNLFRRRDLDGVFREIEDIRLWGYDDLWIADDNFTMDARYLDQFCERMTGQTMGWSCLSRVTGIERATALKMKSAGCHRVYLGLESGSLETLKLMHKRATVEDGKQAVRIFRECGIEVGAFFIVGYPGESVESIDSTFRMALSLPLNEISFNVPFPLPGSPLFDRVVGLDTTKDWDLENEVTFVYSSEFDETWLRNRIAETMQKFNSRL